MNTREDFSIREARIPSRGVEVLTGQIAAATERPRFAIAQAVMTVVAVLLLACSLGVASYASVAAVDGAHGAWRVIGFSLAFAMPLGLFLIVQIPFLRELGRRTAP